MALLVSLLSSRPQGPFPVPKSLLRPQYPQGPAGSQRAPQFTHLRCPHPQGSAASSQVPQVPHLCPGLPRSRHDLAEFAELLILALDTLGTSFLLLDNIQDLNYVLLHKFSPCWRGRRAPPEIERQFLKHTSNQESGILSVILEFPELPPCSRFLASTATPSRPCRFSPGRQVPRPRH